MQVEQMLERKFHAVVAWFAVTMSPVRIIDAHALVACSTMISLQVHLLFGDATKLPEVPLFLHNAGVVWCNNFAFELELNSNLGNLFSRYVPSGTPIALTKHMFHSRSRTQPLTGAQAMLQCPC
ncbi:MAG: hypothetical protein ACKVQA_26075 [Burkholderiales bacterium]